MTDNALEEIEKWLQDDAHRQAYGSENIRLDLAIALAEARHSVRLTQKQLAEMSGVSQAYIAKLESGAANPTIGHIGALVAAMGLRLRFKFEPILMPGLDNALSQELTNHPVRS
ncbi:MAG: helix-turn-helix transcriptional regulator [Dehalococcoidia bacterium]|nr:helix-turn-helix transcriptional regulator [Dehalococcoidia bacterium]